MNHFYNKLVLDTGSLIEKIDSLSFFKENKVDIELIKSLKQDIPFKDIYFLRDSKATGVLDFKLSDYIGDPKAAGKLDFKLSNFAKYNYLFNGFKELYDSFSFNDYLNQIGENINRNYTVFTNWENPSLVDDFNSMVSE